MRDAMLDYTQRHINFSREKNIAKEFNARQRDLKKTDRHHNVALREIPKLLAAMGYTSTTGAGKSSMIAQIKELMDAYNKPLVNLKLNSTQQIKDTMVVYELTQPMLWALNKGSCMFLDATMTHTMRCIIEKKGGTVHDAVIPQNINFTYVQRHLYARRITESDDGYYSPSDIRESKNRMKEGRKIVKFMFDEAKRKKLNPKGLAVLAHKVWFKLSVEERDAETGKVNFEESAAHLSPDFPVHAGWHGNHDRGHNEWENFHLAIMGHSLLSKENIARAYAGERIAMLEAGLKAPIWVPKIDRKQNHEAMLPDDPYVRAWLLEMYAAALAQALGRVRGLNSEEVLCVYQFGGCQNDEMEAIMLRYGITVDRKMEDFAHMTKAEFLTRGTNEDVVEAALNQLILSNATISVSTLHKTVQILGGTAARDFLSEFLAKKRAAGLIPMASVGGCPAGTKRKRRVVPAYVSPIM